jgi:Rho-binding antiterminator
MEGVHGSSFVLPGAEGAGMEKQPYEPVSCDYHDMLEEAAMHKTPVELEFELEGVTQREQGRIADVYSANGAEFVRFESESGPLEIRLDQIIGLLPLAER